MSPSGETGLHFSSEQGEAWSREPAGSLSVLGFGGPRNRTEEAKAGASHRGRAQQSWMSSVTGPSPVPSPLKNKICHLTWLLSQCERKEGEGGRSAWPSSRAGLAPRLKEPLPRCASTAHCQETARPVARIFRLASPRPVFKSWSDDLQAVWNLTQFPQLLKWSS